MRLTYPPNSGVLKDVHPLDNVGVLELEVPGHRLHFFAECHLLEVGLQVVQGVSYLVEAATAVHF